MGSEAPHGCRRRRKRMPCPPIRVATPVPRPLSLVNCQASGFTLLSLDMLQQNAVASFRPGAAANAVARSGRLQDRSAQTLSNSPTTSPTSGDWLAAANAFAPFVPPGAPVANAVAPFVPPGAPAANAVAPALPSCLGGCIDFSPLKVKACPSEIAVLTDLKTRRAPTPRSWIPRIRLAELQDPFLCLALEMKNLGAADGETVLTAWSVLPTSCAVAQNSRLGGVSGRRLHAAQVVTES